MAVPKQINLQYHITWVDYEKMGKDATLTIYPTLDYAPVEPELEGVIFKLDLDVDRLAEPVKQINLIKPI